MPIDLAWMIVKNPSDYPLQILERAEVVVTAAVATEVVPVGDIATRERWLDWHA